MEGRVAGVNKRNDHAEPTHSQKIDSKQGAQVINKCSIHEHINISSICNLLTRRITAEQILVC